MGMPMAIHVTQMPMANVFTVSCQSAAFQPCHAGNNGTPGPRQCSRLGSKGCCHAKCQPGHGGRPEMPGDKCHGKVSVRV